LAAVTKRLKVRSSCPKSNDCYVIRKKERGKSKHMTKKRPRGKGHLKADAETGVSACLQAKELQGLLCTVITS
jgi:hypothetical protein